MAHGQAVGSRPEDAGWRTLEPRAELIVSRVDISLICFSDVGGVNRESWIGVTEVKTESMVPTF
jgi:hypothetical protein